MICTWQNKTKPKTYIFLYVTILWFHTMMFFPQNVFIFFKVSIRKGKQFLVFQILGGGRLGRTGVWIQVLYHLSHITSPILCWVFLRLGLTNYLPRLALNQDPPRIIGVSHWRPALKFVFKNTSFSSVCWCISIIPTTQEAQDCQFQANMGKLARPH
jgi:hypothetical protein